MKTTNLKIGQQVKGTISTIAFGGSGILKIDGFVLFVPYTAPGDEVVAEITALKKGFGEAKIINIPLKSPFRVLPKCPYFGVCMGCQLQHIEYSEQLNLKRQSVIDSLNRIGTLTVPEVTIVGSKDIYHYRERVSLHILANYSGFTVGYIKEDNKSILPIDQCPIFDTVDKPIIKIVIGLLNQLDKLNRNEGRVQIIKDRNNQFLIHVYLKELPDNTSKVVEKAKSEPLIRALYIGNAKRNHAFGDTLIKSEIEGLKFEYTANVFIQNNYLQSLNIYREVINLLKDEKQLLDLYSGIGITSLLLLANGCKVHSIENNERSVKLARQNAEKNQLSSKGFEVANVEDVIASRLTGIDAAIINPPRDGLHKQVVEALNQTPINKIVYISCMPTTLARDLKILSEKYEIKLVQAYDMFPQTGHIETLVLLQKK